MKPFSRLYSPIALIGILEQTRTNVTQIRYSITCFILWHYSCDIRDISEINVFKKKFESFISRMSYFWVDTSLMIKPWKGTRGASLALWVNPRKRLKRPCRGNTITTLKDRGKRHLNNQQWKAKYESGISQCICVYKVEVYTSEMELVKGALK